MIDKDESEYWDDGSLKEWKDLERASLEDYEKEYPYEDETWTYPGE